MFSVAQIALFAVALGFIASAAIGYGFRKKTGCAVAFILVVPAVGVGMAFSLAAGFFHSFCQHSLKMCPPTTAESVWGITFPLIFSPAYWVVAWLAYALGRILTTEDPANTEVPKS